jgi:hypothetical protein
MTIFTSPAKKSPGGHLKKTQDMAIPNEFLADVVLTKSGSELIQTVLDRTLCEAAIAEARKSVAEDDRLHPHVGVVIVKNRKILATGYRSESGDSDHCRPGTLEIEYCALKENEACGHGANAVGPEADGGEQESQHAERSDVGNNLEGRKTEPA